jgi:hypothetical protein
MGTAEALTARIAALEDEAKQKDRRIQELRQELNAERELIDELREHLEDSDSLLESWRDAFDMTLTDDGKWGWSDFIQDAERNAESLHDLRRRWNKFVGLYNAQVAPKPVGRPLAASEAQQRDVLARHKRGRSIRAIASDTALSIATVRTIIDKTEGTDRATNRRRTAALEILPIDRNAIKSEARRQRTRDALPKRLGALMKAREELRRRIKR